MIFEINIKNKEYSYDLGSSKLAIEACRGLDIYKATGKYGDLRRIFANLSWMVSKENSSARQACLATQALALSVFPTLNNYQKFFVADSVTSIYQKAKYPIPVDWMKAQKKYRGIIEENYNRESALEAGLAYIDLRSGRAIVSSIPKYSA